MTSKKSEKSEQICGVLIPNVSELELREIFTATVKRQYKDMILTTMGDRLEKEIDKFAKKYVEENRNIVMDVIKEIVEEALSKVFSENSKSKIAANLAKEIAKSLSSAFSDSFTRLQLY